MSEGRAGQTGQIFFLQVCRPILPSNSKFEVVFKRIVNDFQQLQGPLNVRYGLFTFAAIVTLSDHVSPPPHIYNITGESETPSSALTQAR